VPTPEEELHRLLELVGLADVGDKKAGRFSLGMRQRLGLAIALLGDPEILILDEPINGLDPAGIKEIRDIILELNQKGVTFLISSHLLDELGRIATKFGIMTDGILAEEISAKELKEKCRAFLKVTVSDSQKAQQALLSWRSDLKTEISGNEVHITSRVEDTSEIVITLVNAGVRVYEMRNESIELEDFFIERLG
jgi:ABC-2 type transport system ATP-binding protein